MWCDVCPSRSDHVRRFIMNSDKLSDIMNRILEKNILVWLVHHGLKWDKNRSWSIIGGLFRIKMILLFILLNEHNIIYNIIYVLFLRSFYIFFLFLFVFSTSVLYLLMISSVPLVSRQPNYGPFFGLVTVGFGGRGSFRSLDFWHSFVENQF